MNDRHQRPTLEPVRLPSRYAAVAGSAVVEIEAIELAVRPLGEGTARRFAVARRLAESAVLVAAGIAVGLGVGGSESAVSPSVSPTADAAVAPVIAPAVVDPAPALRQVLPVGPDGRLTAAGERYLFAFGYLPTGTPWYLPSSAAATRPALDTATCAGAAAEAGEDGTFRGCPRP